MGWHCPHFWVCLTLFMLRFIIVTHAVTAVGWQLEIKNYLFTLYSMLWGPWYILAIITYYLLLSIIEIKIKTVLSISSRNVFGKLARKYLNLRRKFCQAFPSTHAFRSLEMYCARLDDQIYSQFQTGFRSCLLRTIYSPWRLHRTRKSHERFGNQNQVQVRVHWITFP